MIKSIGLILLILTGSISGFIASHRLSERVCFLEQYLKFISFLQTEISYSASPLPYLINKYSDERSVGFFLRRCLSNLRSQKTFSQSWETSIKEISDNFGLKKEEINIICDFGCNLGCSDVTGQISHCELNKKLISTYLESAREEKNRKSKLYLMLGVFSGMAVALIFS